jgi:hypothetical protein
MSELTRAGTAVVASMVGGIVEAVVTAALTSQLGPQLAPISGAGIGKAAEEIANQTARIFQDRRRRSVQMVEEAAAFSEEDVIVLVERLLAYEGGRLMLHRAVQAAADAASASKIKTLARALASGAMSEDQAVVDEALIVIDAVGQLEAPHIRLLQLLTQDRGPFIRGVNGFSTQPWSIEDLIDADPGLRNAMQALIAKLLSLGMVERLGSGLLDGHEDKIVLSRFGGVCMLHMRDAGAGRAE